MVSPLRRFVPSVATLGALSAGFVSIGLAAEGEYYLAAAMIIVAVLLDSADGALARHLNACSELGAELDSLSDVVSFGVAPAVLVGRYFTGWNPWILWPMLAAYPACAALRLARYNVRSRMEGSEHGAFTGLPTTGAGGCVAATVLALEGVVHDGHLLGIALPWLMVLLAVLMVSTIPYRHIGVLMARQPLPYIVGGALLALMASLQGAHELIFAVFFWGYAASGPVIAVGMRIREARHAHLG